MPFEHNPYSFMTGEDPFFPATSVEKTQFRVDREVVFEDRHEGFIGIPHGGLAMGLCLDAWRQSGLSAYPVDARFKFGGSGIKIGDAAVFTVERGKESQDPRVAASITKIGDKTPYLRAEITPAARSEPSTQVPTPPSEEFRKLPYYRNCFVCGHHRTVTGLQRRFRLHVPQMGNIITSEWAAASDDLDRAKHFLIGREELHPAVLSSIFDENTAWGGFMLTRSCGLSVRASLTLLRPVGRNERLLFVGWPTGTRGNPRSPRFFLAEGTVLSLADPESPEPVAYGRGEWIVMNAYTDQIKTNLLPEDDWQWIFRDGEQEEAPGGRD